MPADHADAPDRAIALASWLAEVELATGGGEWATARAALERDLDAAAANAGLAALYGEVLLRLGHPREASEWLEARLVALAGSANRRALIRMVNLAGAAAFETGRIDAAARCFAAARERAAALADHLTEARALNNLALVASTRGDWGTAMEHYRQAIPAYERLGALRGVAECAHNIATTLLESGDLEAAEEWQRRGIELAAAIEAPALRAHLMSGRAELRLRRADPGMALALAQRAAQDFHALADRASEAHAHGIAGQAAHALRRERGEARPLAPEVREALDRAVTLASESGVARIVGECRLARARVLLDVSAFDEAVHDLREARAAFTTLGAPAKQRLVDGLLVTAEALAADQRRA
jgi:tetratricopeptide (TPR) repeat protein